MIAHVFGVVAEKFGSSIIVDVHDIGYEVQVAASDFERAILGDPIKVYTYHHVREQSEDLFGFSSLAAKKLFEQKPNSKAKIKSSRFLKDVSNLK